MLLPSRSQVQPRLSDEAAEQLVTEYVALRKVGSSVSSDPNRRVITATPRQLESLVRMSEAHARMRLSPMVESTDVDEVPIDSDRT